MNWTTVRDGLLSHTWEAVKIDLSVCFEGELIAAHPPAYGRVAIWFFTGTTVF